MMGYQGGWCLRFHLLKAVILVANDHCLYWDLPDLAFVLRILKTIYLLSQSLLELDYTRLIELGYLL